MKNFKKENGAITIIVLVSVLFMVSFLISSYILISNKVNAQKEVLEETRSIYESKVSMEQIYNAYFNNDKIVPIRTVDQLLKIGSGEKMYIDNKIYVFSKDKIYTLMNDIEFDSKAIGLTKDWIPIGEYVHTTPGFIGIFEGNNHIIKVKDLSGKQNVYTKENEYGWLKVNLPENWVQTDKPGYWENDRVIAITDGTYIIPLPDGYVVSEEEGENTIEEGVVIKDPNGNEFVWIPTTRNLEYGFEERITNNLVGEVQYIEPIEVTDISEETGYPYDSQETLDYYYDGLYIYDASDIESDFAYEQHYLEMVDSINNYGGFYIGRYETTTDSVQEVGSRPMEHVLTTGDTVNMTKGKPVRWWGLYSLQRNSTVLGNKDYVQTNMIWGQLYNHMQEHFESMGIDYMAEFTSDANEALKSGETTSGGEYDIIYNIYDLRNNTLDCTAETTSIENGGGTGKTTRGGAYESPLNDGGFGVMTRWVESFEGISYAPDMVGSRLILYVK